MRTKSRSYADRHQHIRNAYRELHPHCELTRYAPYDIRNYTCRAGQNEVHHIAGRGRYAEVPGNWITVTPSIHDWISDHRLAGFVLCAWVREKQGRADWDTWQRCWKHYRRTALDTDKFIEACRGWDAVERMRAELLGTCKGELTCCLK